MNRIIAVFFLTMSFSLHAFQNAFVLKSDDGLLELGNRDIKCISLSENSEAVKILFKDYSAHLLRNYTASNKGKKMSYSFCGHESKSLKIMSPIGLGSIAFSLDKEHRKSIKDCLKKTFELNNSCKVCPVCK